MAKITGTSVGDNLTGTDGYDDIEGLGGNDFIDGKGGDDFIRGGPGYNVLTGGPGNQNRFMVSDAAGSVNLITDCRNRDVIGCTDSQLHDPSNWPMAEWKVGGGTWSGKRFVALQLKDGTQIIFQNLPLNADGSMPNTTQVNLGLVLPGRVRTGA